MTYFALRSYLPKGHALKAQEIGSEPTPEAFIETMVRVFREVRRVMREDGVLFINLGDSYAANRTYQVPDGKWCDVGNSGGMQVPAGLQSGDLMNLPHRVAESLRADGWIWRQTIVWAKRSPMPESVSGWRWMRCRVKVKAQPKRKSDQTVVQYDRDQSGGVQNAEKAVWSDCPGCPKCKPHGGYVLRRGAGRCCTAHEYIFVFAKTARYYWDSVAIAKVFANDPYLRDVQGNEARLGVLSEQESARWPLYEMQDLHEDVESSEAPQPERESGATALVEREGRKAKAHGLATGTASNAGGPGRVSETGRISSGSRSGIEISPVGQGQTNPTLGGAEPNGDSIASRQRQCQSPPLRAVAEVQGTDDSLSPVAKRSCLEGSTGSKVEGVGEGQGGQGEGSRETKERCGGSIELPDFWAVDGDSETPRLSVPLLQETDGAVDNGSCHADQQGGIAHQGERRGCLPVVQLPQRGADHNAVLRPAPTPRSVWTLSSEPTSQKHFATFPSELVRRCLSAGVSAGGCCAKCGAPWAAVVQSNRVPTRPGEDTKVEGTKDEEHGNRDPERHVTETDCLGYLPTCECGLWAGKPLRPLVEVLKDIEPVRQGCLILDPFGGIGTTAQTAEHLGHRSISIELNPEYHEIACKRVLEPPRWWLRETGEVLDDEPSDAPLFAGAP